MEDMGRETRVEVVWGWRDGQTSRPGLENDSLQLEVGVHLSARGGGGGALSERGGDGVVCWTVPESCRGGGA